MIARAVAPVLVTLNVSGALGVLRPLRTEVKAARRIERNRGSVGDARTAQRNGARVSAVGIGHGDRCFPQTELIPSAGVNCRLMPQVACGPRDCPAQESLSTKSGEVSTRQRDRVHLNGGTACWLATSTRDCAALGAYHLVAEIQARSAIAPICSAAEIPVPDRLTFCGLPAALSEMVNVPVAGPGDLGSERQHDGATLRDAERVAAATVGDKEEQRGDNRLLELELAGCRCWSG